MPRTYAKTRGPATAEQVYAAAVHLHATRTHIVHNGRQGRVPLPGPNVTDVARHLERDDSLVRPALLALVAEGRLAVVTCGASRCYLPAPQQETP